MEFRSLIVLILSTYVTVVELRRADGARDPSQEGGKETQRGIQTKPECDSVCTSACARGCPDSSESLPTAASASEHSGTSVQSGSSVSCAAIPQNYSGARSARTSATSALSVTSNCTSPHRSPVSTNFHARTAETGVLLNDDKLSSLSRSVGLPEPGRLGASAVAEGATAGLAKRDFHDSPDMKPSASFPDDPLKRSDFENPVSSKLFPACSRTYKPFEGPQISRSNPLYSAGTEREGNSLLPRLSPCLSAEGLEQSSSCRENLRKESSIKSHPMRLRSSAASLYLAGRQQLHGLPAADTSQHYRGSRERPDCTAAPENPISSPLLCKYEDDVHRSPSDRCRSMCTRQPLDKSSSIQGGNEDSLATNSMSVIPPHSTSSREHLQYDIPASAKRALHNTGGLLGQLLNSLISEDETSSDEDAQEELSRTQRPGLSNEGRQFPEEGRDSDGSAETTATDTVREELSVAHCVGLRKGLTPSLSEESHDSDSAVKSERKLRKKLLKALRHSRVFGSDTIGRPNTNNDSPNPTRSTFSHFTSSRTRRSEVTSRPASDFSDFPDFASNASLSSFSEKNTSPSLPPQAPPLTTPPADVLLAHLAATRRHFRSLQDGSGNFSWRIRPQRIRPISSVSLFRRTKVVTPIDAVPEAHAESNRAMQVFRPEDDALWTELMRYEHVCSNTLLQLELGILTLEVRDLVDTMKQDSLRQGPCFQDPEICQKLRPQMRCPCLLLFTGAEDLIGLASKAPQSSTLSTPDKRRAHVLKTLVPTGKEIEFTSLVSGRTFALKQTGIFRLESSIHLMVMEDAKGGQTFLEIGIVDCNEMDEDIVFKGEVLRLQALKQFRKQTGLKISAITEATGLSGVHDIWTFKHNGETVTRYIEKDSLYAVTPFVKVKRPWLTDLATLVVLLKEEALQAESQNRVFIMRLNLTVQILAVVCCLDTHGILPRSFKMRHFALTPKGTVMYLLPPYFVPTSKRASGLNNVVVPHRSSFSLAMMLTTVWCSSRVDYHRLCTGWPSPEHDYFQSCVPEMPVEVKNLIVDLCAPTTVNLYDLLEKNDFQSLLRSVRKLSR